jgi:hypothetical protein
MLRSLRLEMMRPFIPEAVLIDKSIALASPGAEPRPRGRPGRMALRQHGRPRGLSPPRVIPP